MKKDSVQKRVKDFDKLVNPARYRKRKRSQYRKRKRERVTTTVNLSPKHYARVIALAELRDECVSTVMRQLIIKGVYEALGMKETRHKPKV